MPNLQQEWEGFFHKIARLWESHGEVSLFGF